MIVLGIADNHDSGAAVVIDGELVSAVNQERIDRIKNSGAFPWNAIDEALEVAGIGPRDVQRIVVGTGFTPATLLRAFPDRHHDARGKGQFSPLLHAYILYQSALRATGLHTVEIDASAWLLRRRLADRPFERFELELMDHHRAHAEGAYRTQPHPRCLVLTVDAMGDGTTATANMGLDGDLDLLWRQSGLASVNTFYSRITEFLGFVPNRHEGKVTGLAAYVEPPPALLTHMKGRVRFCSPGFTRVSITRPERPDDPFWSELKNWSREEISSAAQRTLEDAVVPFVRHWVQTTGCPHVAVAGGIFANVKLNQRITEIDEVETLWVMPHMGDGGLAVGAALGTVGTSPRAIPHVYLGPGYDDQQVRSALNAADEDSQPPEDPIGRVVELLVDEKIVARHDGCMEWGPRALGNRSILARPHDPHINDFLNEKLSRSEFMPFAPVVRVEDVDRWFHGVRHAPEASRFMTVCFETTAAFRQACPAAVHVDGTARPQVVTARQNPSLHTLLGRIGEATGVPVLVNTSFNMHEQPMVCTPDDAIRAWRAAEIDGLWIGRHVVERVEPSTS